MQHFLQHFQCILKTVKMGTNGRPTNFIFHKWNYELEYVAQIPGNLKSRLLQCNKFLAAQINSKVTSLYFDLVKIATMQQYTSSVS